VHELLGYAFSPLRKGDIALYRGSSDSSAPILLVAAEETSLGCVERLEHEHALKEELDADWAARPVALALHDGRMTLVLEDPGGTPLDRLLGRPLDVSHFLSIAIPLAGALRRMHERGLIHKDIKPTNILVDRASGGVWLTGFGIASRLPREHQAPAPPEVIAGTLAYMAPEQTGRMNRSVDSRSDLYAMGVTFYEMLTGQLPFTAADPMEWVHCHVARQPVPPNEQGAGVPAPLSAIVMKLLAKTAEERYQTAAGVEDDLKRCLAEWKSHGRIEPFRLGTEDAPGHLLIPENLYGRESEIDTLLASFNRVVANGTFELLLVSGYSGIGKSSVVHELHKVLVPSRGLFAAGKFDQYKRDIPYATVGQAFQSLVRALLTRSEEELGRWRVALREALGPNGQLMVNLVPELELVMGKQPPVADLPPQEAQNRFQMVFRRFIGVFARKEHPLALFLDDLQWLDAATLDLLEDLATQPDVRHLLLVGAYRDNEVGPSHPLMRTLEAIRKAGARVQEIVLCPLGENDIRQLAADAMRCESERVLPLAQLVQEKTGGNPFFAIQFFIELADEGLLAFDPVTRAWQWQIDRIRAKNYADNVVDLMVGKLKRFTGTSQEALKQLACLGNVAPIANLAPVHGTTEAAMHAALWEAVHAGLVFREDGAYRFLHDRIQQAAYSLIADEQRADVHLRIGRALLADMTADELAEHLFDVANQFNRGAARLIDRDEKTQVAAIDLRAGRKAKASAAFESACVYLASGMGLLDERDWSSQHRLMFSLRLERAECELLTGNFDAAEQLIVELLQRGASKVDQAAVYNLKILLHTVKSENAQAVASALAGLRLFGIDIPAHPTWEQVQAEYEQVWQTINGRPIESLIDLPLMTNPEQQAAMQVLSTLLGPAYFTDFHLFCLLVCRMVNVSTQHGMCGASAHAYGYWGIVLGPVFHRYQDGFRSAKLACDLVEKHGFIAYRAKAYRSMGIASLWTQPITTALDFNRAAFRAASETGDLTYACYSVDRSVLLHLLRNDSLDAVWRESETSLDFVRKAGYGDIAENIVSQQRFIATMQGRAATFTSFNDEQFDEAAFEAQLMANRTAMMVFYYWILKLKARFLSGDYPEALAAADKAEALLWISAAHIHLLDYFYYTALTVASLYEIGTADEQIKWRELLTAHREQLREWAENNPQTFADKHALVLAEIARLERRDTDAMRLYEQAIRSARENGFVQNEGLAHELAARFYAARGVTTVAHAYLREARRCYRRWGAFGKVRQLEQLHLHLRDAPVPASPTATIGAPVDQLDVGTVLKAAEAVSGEIVLGKLIATLLRIAVEHAGAERGLLILFPDGEPRIAAEATTGRGQVEVTLREAAASPAELPESVFHTVIRTRESVILDDAQAQNPFSADEYISQKRARSVLCLPLVKQAKLIGVLYLENNLASHVFTPTRISVLELLASQAAISLENARLYRDLAEREAKVRRLVDANIIGIFIFDLEGRIVEANEAFLQMVGYDREDFVAGRVRWTDLTPPEWRDRHERAVTELKRTGTVQPYEREYFRKDGIRVPALIGSAAFDEQRDQGVAFVLDLTERKRAESLLAAEKRILEMLAKGDSLTEILDSLCRLVEERTNGALASILLLEGDRLRHGGAPSLPKAYINAIDGAVIGPSAGSCGTAAYRREPVIVENIATDPLWADYRDLALPHSLRACWSTPVFSSQDKVIATFAVYYREPRRPTQRDQEIIDQVTHLTGIAIQKKLALDKLQRSEAYLAEAQKLTHTGSWAWDPRTHWVLYCSEEMFRIFGLDPRESLPTRKNFRQRIHPEDRDWIDKRWEKSLRERVDSFDEFRVLMPDGTVRHINSSAHPVLDEDGELIEFVGTAVDVTERRRTEHERRLLASLVEQATDLMAIADLNGGTPIYLNKAGLKMVGLDSLEEARTRRGLHYVFPEDREFVNTVLWPSVLGKGAWSGEMRFRHFKTGEPIPILYSAFRIDDPETGQPVNIGNVCSDITDRKRAEEKLRASEQRLVDAQMELARVTRVTTLGELTASIAHEVNQPLAAVIANAEACLRWLDRETPNLKAARHSVEWVIQDGIRASEVIRRVRALAKKTDIEKGPLDINDVVREVIALVQRELASHQISLQMELAPALPMTLGDRVQLQQVIINLVMNGIEAMQPVTDRPREVVIRSRLDETQQVLVGVTDCGVGISAENADRIFNAFFTTKSSGMGMGLSICRSIIEAHGGRLWATANTLHGATFQFTLPVNADTASTEPRLPADSGP
jgi:PAS domain S-box-containing protein